jgi:hypothetical protein
VVWRALSLTARKSFPTANGKKVLARRAARINL